MTSPAWPHKSDSLKGWLGNQRSLVSLLFLKKLPLTYKATPLGTPLESSLEAGAANQTLTTDQCDESN